MCCMKTKMSFVLAGFTVLSLSGFAQTNTTAPAGSDEAQAGRPPAPRKPCVVLILADDLGYGDLGCYGQTMIQTTNIDKLAAEGMRFTSFYAGSTVSAPSRASLMLGQHTGHLRVRGDSPASSLEAGDITMARRLKDAGYRTGLVGKWGLAMAGSSGVPWKQGFDEFAGYLDSIHAHDYYTSQIWRYDFNSGFDGQVQIPENFGLKRGLYIPDLCTKSALNFIRYNNPEFHNKYRPYFLSLNYTIPHANNEEARAGRNAMQVPSDAPYSAEAWPVVERNKAAMITRLDDAVGKIMASLKARKLDEDAIVIFTSDNGPHNEGGVNPKFFQSSGPLRGIKRDLTEGGIRVPFIIRWPFAIKPGSVCNDPWAFWDIMPTLLEAAYQTPPTNNCDGISFYPTLLGQPQTNRHDFFYWEFHEKGFHQAVRQGDWKGIRHGIDGKMELYNLRTNPGENIDVAPDHRDIVAGIEERMKSARVDDPDYPALKAGAVQENATPAR